MRNYPPTPTDKIKKKKKKIIFPTMAAADGSLGRSSEERRDTAVVEVEVVAAAARRGPLQIYKILELHSIIKYISFPMLACILFQRVGFNENKRRASLKVMEKTE